jgi:hypothetical protein
VRERLRLHNGGRIGCGGSKNRICATCNQDSKPGGNIQ